MKIRLLAPLAAALLAIACGDVRGPGQDIAAPSIVKPVPGAPASLVLLAASRQDQQLDVSAQILDGNGVGVPSISVTFSIVNGVVVPPTVVTDANGMAKSIAAASGTVALTATTGTLSKTATVIAGATPLSVSLSVPSIVINNPSQFTANVAGTPLGGPFVFTWNFGDGTGDSGTTNTIAHAYNRTGSQIATVTVKDGAGRSATGTATAVVTDPVVVTPTPTPGSSDSSGLVATLTCTGNAHGTASPCNVSAAYNGKNIASGSITAIAWDWGDGGNVAGAAVPLGSHNYAQAGTYIVTATVTATTSDGSKVAPIVSKQLTIS